MVVNHLQVDGTDTLIERRDRVCHSLTPMKYIHAHPTPPPQSRTSVMHIIRDPALQQTLCQLATEDLSQTLGKPGLPTICDVR